MCQKWEPPNSATCQKHPITVIYIKYITHKVTSTKNEVIKTQKREIIPTWAKRLDRGNDHSAKCVPVPYNEHDDLEYKLAASRLHSSTLRISFQH
jgi:hypothetical protein